MHNGVIGLPDYKSPYELYKKSLNPKYDYYKKDGSKLKKIDLDIIKNLPLDEKYYQRYGYSSNCVQYRTDKESINVIMSDDNVQLSKNEINSPYTIIETYSLKTKSLIVEVKRFSNCNIGISKEYDEKGSLIKETDWNRDFQFSIESLIEKMKKEFDVDILAEEEMSVDRFFDPDIRQSFYEVMSGSEMYEYFLLDGNTGELLFRKYIEEGEKSPYEQYVKSLNKQK